VNRAYLKFKSAALLAEQVDWVTGDGLIYLFTRGLFTTMSVDQSRPL
jgi:hypothetical protein